MTTTEALEWIKSFLERVDSQDNRATAKPVQFLLQKKREYVAHDDYNFQTRTVYRHPEMESSSYETKEEAIAWLKEYGYDGARLLAEVDNIERFEMGHYWETDQAFLTKEGVDRHIKLNRHNLGEHRDYVVHTFRNPEMVELFKALRAIDALGNKIRLLELYQEEHEKFDQSVRSAWPIKPVNYADTELKVMASIPKAIPFIKHVCPDCGVLWNLTKLEGFICPACRIEQKVRGTATCSCGEPTDVFNNVCGKCLTRIEER